jgi:hypothetical protein
MFEILIEPAPTDGIFIFRNHLISNLGFKNIWNWQNLSATVIHGRDRRDRISKKTKKTRDLLRNAARSPLIKKAIPNHKKSDPQS